MGSASPSDRRPAAYACRPIDEVEEAKVMSQYDHARQVFVNVSDVRYPFPDNIFPCPKML